MRTGPKTGLPRPEVLNCVHCGLCLDACPTYRVLKQEPDSPRGRIYLMRALQEGRIETSEEVLSHFDLCLNCRACETACPAGVHYGDLIERTRAQVFETGKSGFLESIAAVFLNSLFHPRERIDLVVESLRSLQRLGLMQLAGHSRLSRLLPPPFRIGARLLPEVPSRSERTLPVGVHTAYPPHQARPRARVGLFGTCVVQPLYPRVNRALLHLLRVAGCEVVVPDMQTCCGSLHIHAGFRDQARVQARVNMDAFAEGLDYVTVASAGCGATLKEYESLFSDDGHTEQERLSAESFAVKVRDGLELLDEIGLPEPVRPVPERIAVHDPCHLVHGQGVREAPRRLLKSLASSEVVDLEHSDWCCGSAGIYNLKHPEIADQLLEQKLLTVEAAAPTVVSVANPGCLLQMEAGARERGLMIPFVHPLEIVARAYPEPGAYRDHSVLVEDEVGVSH